MIAKFNIGDTLVLSQSAKDTYTNVFKRPEMVDMEAKVLSIRDNGIGVALYTLDTPDHTDAEEYLQLAEPHLVQLTT